MRIEDILARRSDLSTFLVHLTRDTDGQDAEANLKSIIKGGAIHAKSAFGPAAKHLEDKGLDTSSQRVVCFTETPLEQSYYMFENIDERQFRFKPFGIAITKRQGRNDGVNPVWYTDISPTGHAWLIKSVQALIEEAAKRDDFIKSPILKLTPFIEQMGSGPRASGVGGYRKEFWWEREWRHKGDFELPKNILVLCPEDRIANIMDFIDRLDTEYAAKCIDPRWSLERIIGCLAGFEERDLKIL